MPKSFKGGRRGGKAVPVRKRVGCFFCHNNCGLLVEVEGDRVVSVRGDPEAPWSRGFMCERPRMFATKWLYHPDRVKHPLKRVGERGEGRWKRVTWDEALDEIAAKLRELKERYGPECLAFAEGTYRSDMNWARARFANLFGNPQNVISPGTICYLNTMAIELAVLGTPIFHRPHIRGSNCIVFWGANPSESQSGGLPWNKTLERLAMKPRPKIIVVDPRLTECARRADLWLQIRPGTDLALELAWINVIINEGLYDREFVEKWCYGFDKLKERVKEYTPERVSEITWIPEDKIVESARTFATNRPSCIVWGVSLDQQGVNATYANMARTILIAITGNIDVPGGHLLYEPAEPKGFVHTSELELVEKLPPEQRRKHLGGDRHRLMSWAGWELINQCFRRMFGLDFPVHPFVHTPAPLLWRAILTGKPYPIKALITWQSNPLVWAPDTKLVYKALKSENLELHVVMDYWLTPTAMLADYVLPAATWLERPLCTMAESDMDIVKGGERAVQPLGEARTDYELFRGLGVRLGQAEYWPWETYEEVVEYRIKGLGLTYREWCERPWTDYPKTGFKRYEKRGGFATPTGKVELYSTIFEKLGYDPLPRYVEPPESPISTPDVAKEYPYILITGARFRPMYHSEHRQLNLGSRELHPDPIVEVHPHTARAHGIRDGDWCWIETRRGRIKQRARLTWGIHPRVISVEHGWWFPERPGEDPVLYGVFESCANVLTLSEPDTLDPLVGGWCNRGLLCRIYRAEEPKAP